VATALRQRGDFNGQGRPSSSPRAAAARSPGR
jgi:hypothetical protein